ncbi:MAG: hypothetical protein J5958_05355 [Clostridia bacterium]|nr:hypothetical protein [Clostridia bacterium]
MKKRLIALLLLVVTLLLLLASCEVADGIDAADSATGTRAETAGENVADAGTGADETGSGTTLSVPGQTTAATTKAGAPASTKATTAATTKATTVATTAATPDYEIPVMMSAVKEPKAGDDPAKLSGIENVMRIAWVLQHAEKYSVDGTGTVKASITTQSVKVYKDYNRGVMLEIDITTSSMVNSATQFCYVGNTAMMRDASGAKKTWNGRQTAWKTSATKYSLSDYRSSYGLFGCELTNYLLNESTVTEWSAVTKNSDGTYTQTIKPNTSTSTKDYVHRMKKMGGLDKDPSFSKAEITLTFDKNWKILSMHIDETYKAKMTLEVTCKASSDYTYTYGKADMSAYDNFFAAKIK